MDKNYTMQPSMLARAKELSDSGNKEALLQYIQGVKDAQAKKALYKKFYPNSKEAQDTELGKSNKWLQVGTKVEMEHTKDKKIARKIAQDHLREDPDYYKDWENKEKILFQEKAPIKKSELKSLIEKLTKGGPGSGQRGHQSGQDNQSDEPKINKLDEHLNQLQSGATLDNRTTQSGKPILLNMEHATAHGYTPDDHRDAMNVHYDVVERWNNALKKFEEAGHEIPEQAKKILKFHQKKMKEHFSARQTIMDRQAKTESQTKDKVEKATTQMGHQTSPDINIAEHAVSLESAQNSKWLERLYNLMEDYDYGDSPRTIALDKGDLTLVKVADGEYTGFFTKIQKIGDGEMADNEKMRIERITLPDLVQLMMAKEYINPLEEKEAQLEPIEVPELVEPEPVLNVEPLIDKLKADDEERRDQKIYMLELLNKLIN